MATTPPAVTDDPRGVDALAADGTIITLRPIRPDDRTALADLYGDASGSLAVRFFSLADRAARNAEIDVLCLPETGQRLALAAWDGAELVGVACCARLGTGGDSGEIAVLVAEPHHGRGIGTLLLEHLVTRARHAGITRFLGDALTGDSAVVRRTRGTVPVTTTDLTDVEVLQRAVGVRDRPVEQSSLRALLAPRSVAVIGAMQRRGSTGFETVRALHDYGFRGRLYPVSNTGRPVCGVPGYRSIADLPESVDLLVVAVPAERVPQTLCEAGRHGTHSAVVLSRCSTDGPAGRRELRQIARRYGIRLIGPNSLGVLNTDPQVRLNASISPARPLTGGLAVVAQSAAVGIALLEHAARNGCGVTSFVSLGDGLDLSSNDLMSYWYADARTRVVALHLGSFGDPRTFARTVRALGRRKPVLALSDQPGTVHSSDGLYAQAGMIRVTSLDEMIDTARILMEPLPAGNRLGIVGNAEGLTALAADGARTAGLVVTPLSLSVRRQLSGKRDNPVDLGADATPQQVAETVDIVATSGEIDILLVMVVGTRTNVPSAIMATLAEVLDNRPQLTAAVVLTGSADDLHRLGNRGTPVYRQPDRALRAMANAYRYARWRREPLGRWAPLGGIQTEQARKLIEQTPTDRGGWVPRSAAVDIMAAYGIAVLPAAYASTGVNAVAAAERLGYPVTLMPGPDPVSSSHRGAVRLDLNSATAVRESFEAVTRSSSPRSGVLVQHQLTAPMELAATITQDPAFGPVVGLGLGGRHTDRDGRVAHLVPLTDLDAARMWHPLQHPSSVNAVAVEDLLLRLGKLAEEHPELAELDLSPMLAGPNGVIATNVHLRLTTGGSATR
ncbi:GNAT family N-acetyltransferase [Actinoplanes sp. NPDC024001]|uniref:bifunctional acetate--CoA ligase family protein/GNAT family N-acetyltransferase n=1 Tax=Actinoplanes sp. NPDC024001 TaxID=3154598 RepID=UPI0033E5B780